MESKIKIQNIYYLLSYAWDCVGLNDSQISSVDTFSNTENLYARLISVLCEPLIKQGFTKEYLSESLEVNGIKGKLDISLTLKSGKLFFGKTICESDSYNLNNPLNQTIKASIIAILSFKGLTKANTKDLKDILIFLANVSEKKLSNNLFRSISFNSLNRNYVGLVEIAKLIHQNTVISSSEGKNKLNNFLDSTLDMAALFEKFLRNFYLRELINAKVSAQRLTWDIHYSSDLQFKERIPALLTDISIVDEDRVLVIDAKFYQEAMTSNQGNRFKYRRDHISQIMEYLRTSKKKYAKDVYGVLLYPTVEIDINDFGVVEGLPVRIATVDLSKPWSEIKCKLLELHQIASEYDRNAIDLAA